MTQPTNNFSGDARRTAVAAVRRERRRASDG